MNAPPQKVWRQPRGHFRHCAGASPRASQGPREGRGAVIKWHIGAPRPTNLRPSRHALTGIGLGQNVSFAVRLKVTLKRKDIMLHTLVIRAALACLPERVETTDSCGLDCPGSSRPNPYQRPRLTPPPDPKALNILLNALNLLPPSVGQFMVDDETRRMLLSALAAEFSLGDPHEMTGSSGSHHVYGGRLASAPIPPPSPGWGCMVDANGLEWR